MFVPLSYSLSFFLIRTLFSLPTASSQDFVRVGCDIRVDMSMIFGFSLLPAYLQRSSPYWASPNRVKTHTPLKACYDDCRAGT